MHLPRKLLLLAIAATAAFAFAAANASATDTVQVVDEDTAQVCTELTNGHTEGGCIVHFDGQISIRADLVFFEINEATCNLEIEMRVGPTGETGVYDVEHNTGPDANCSTFLTECDLPWEGHGEEDGPTGVVQAEVSVCIDLIESDSNCVGVMDFNIVETTPEHLSAVFSDTVGLCELDVSLEIEHEFEPHEEIHINHP